MAIEKWQIISQQTVFEHPRIVLVEDTVRLPNGEQIQYLRYRRDGDAATIIALREDGKILLQQEYSHPPNEILFQFPGGGVPKSEDIFEGANRELMEECSLRGKLEKIGEYYIDNRRSEAKMHVFVASDLEEADLPGDPEEFIEHDWYSEKQIDALVADGELKHSHPLATWALFKAWRNR